MRVETLTPVVAAAPGARIVQLGQSAGPAANLPSAAIRGKQLELSMRFVRPVRVGPAVAQADLRDGLGDEELEGEQPDEGAPPEPGRVHGCHGPRPRCSILATTAAWVFCILYAILSHGAWLRTKYGRHLMVLTLGLALLGTHSLARDVWGSWGWLGGDDFHRDVIYAILAYQLVNRDVLLILSHVKGEKRRKAELTRPTRPAGEEHAGMVEQRPSEPPRR